MYSKIQLVINNSFRVVVVPIVHGIKSYDNIVLRQNDDHLPICTALENIKLL